jgi:putative redox protein
MKKSVTATLIPGAKFAQEVKAGTFTMTCDLTIAQGGSGKGADPKDFLLGALASCIAMTIIGSSSKRNWDIQSISVTVTRDEEPDPDDKSGTNRKRPVFSEEVKVKGNLSAQELADIEATAKKCPVARDFAGPKRMETKVTLLP